MANVVYRGIVVALLIFLGGWLGLKMAVPPGYASPLWPPAGIALAALLLDGRWRLWPAIWLGSFANNVLAGADISQQLSLAVFMSSALIGLGSSLQALTAVWLSKKFIHSGIPLLDNPRQILSFFLLSGPLACLVAPSVGVSSLFLLELMPPAQLPVSWANWWIGDSLGVLLVTPLIFCLLAEPRERWKPRMIRVALPLLLTLLALATTFFFVFRAEKARVQLAFDNQAAGIERLLREYMHNVLDNTQALSDLFQSAEGISREEFSQIAVSLIRRHPEIQALEWLPRVAQAELSGFEQQLRALGFAQFRVTERMPDGSFKPVAERNEYFPILYVEPWADNESIFGLDSMSNPISKASKEWARTNRKGSASQGLKLAQRDDKEVGVLLSIPVFDSRKANAGPDELAGFVSAVLLPARMVESAMQDRDRALFGVTLRDLNSLPAGSDLLFNQPVAHPVHRNDGLKNWQSELPFGERNWQLSITADTRFIAEYGSILPWATLFGGLCFTSLLSVLLLTMTGRTAQAEALANVRTRELEAVNRELKALASNLQESESKLRILVQAQPECVKLLSSKGELLEMNQAGLNLIDADSFDQVKGQIVYPLVTEQCRQAFIDSVHQVFDGQSATLEFEICSLKGVHRWLDTHAVPLRDNDGNITALLGMTRDITARKQAEEHLRLAARVFGEAHEGILITDAAAKVIDVNPMFCEITGYSRDEILGNNPRILQSGKHSQEFYRDMWQTLQTSKHWQGEVWNRKKSGELYAELLTISALCDDQGRILHYVGLFSDITQSKEQQQMLELMAHYDPLTHLPNRTLFADRFLQAMARSRREKSLLAICFLDLDGFKPVNDQFGHDAGDQVLIEVADRIKNSLREQDTVSRHGGDEFALLLGELHSVEECEQAISRIHQVIAEPYQINGQTLIIGASSGITIFPLDDADSDTLLRHADHAMYQAKLAGKNCYEMFDASQDQQTMDRNKQLREIEAGFDGRQFCLFYQPKVNIRTGQVVGAEALIRWQHPERGLVPPLAFLPAIASNELEIRIGNWVIETAWQQLVAWHRQGLKLQVSVNISSYHLLWAGFATYLETVMATASDVNSSYFQLEILESTALDDLAAINRVVKLCRDALGISTALDDFGTGYSSLTHLRHLPVDTVKIDKSFVRDMLDDPDDFAIVESVLGLSHAFSRDVVAEGVENQEQGSVLLLMGCHLAQGYAIAKPMPADELALWNSNYRPYADWLFHASLDLSTEQLQIAIRRIDLAQWLQGVSRCLNANGYVAHWPTMVPGKTHFGRWLNHARLHQQYDEQWLVKLARLHKELLEKGMTLMHQYWQGDGEGARAGFAELQILQQQIDRYLTDYA